MKRKWLIACFGLALLAAHSANALTLGELKITTVPGDAQAFYAEIPVHNADTDVLDSLSIGVFSLFDEDADEVGWESLVATNEAGESVILLGQVADAPAMRDAVELRVVMNWVNGQIARDYQLAIEQGVLTGKTISTARFGPITERMNLYRVAERLRPAGISINQMMVRLLADNPNAFAVEHVNALEVGRYLQLPMSGTDGFVTVERADQLIAQQLAIWNAVRAEIPDAAPAPSWVENEDFDRRDRVVRSLAEDNQRLGQRIQLLQQELLARIEASRQPPPERQVSASSDAVEATDSAPWQMPVWAPSWLSVDTVKAAALVFGGAIIIIFWGLRARQRRKVPKVPSVTDPVLAEVDVQVNAGNLAAAQEALDIALGQSPERIDLRLRLLQILAYRQDALGFESEAYVLSAQISDNKDPRWQEVVRRGRKLLPDHALFADE